MAAVNPITKEILIKIVYYGPGLGGKTTTLEYIHKTTRPEHRGKMISLSTPVDRTLYFDFLPIRLPKIGGYTFRLQLFTVPGQVHYNATRKLVLTGADGVVFVADSQPSRMDANVESVENLRDNLAEQKISVDAIPLSFQFNKRDLEDVVPIEELNRILNSRNKYSVGTCATKGGGVFEGLQAITKITLKDLKKREILIHDDSEESKRIESQIAFRKEDQGILNSVKEFSESTSSLDLIEPGSDEKTATYEVALQESKPTDPPPKSYEPGNRPGARRLPDPAITPAVNAADTVSEEGGTTLPLTFATLFPVAEHGRVLDIESAIVEGRDFDAISNIWTGITHYLKSASAGLPDKSDEQVVKLLGLDGRRYLEVSRIVHGSKAGDPIAQATILKAYLFLLQIVTAL